MLPPELQAVKSATDDPSEVDTSPKNWSDLNVRIGLPLSLHFSRRAYEEVNVR